MGILCGTVEHRGSGAEPYVTGRSFGQFRHGPVEAELFPVIPPQRQKNRIRPDAVPKALELSEILQIQTVTPIGRERGPVVPAGAVDGVLGVALQPPDEGLAHGAACAE